MSLQQFKDRRAISGYKSMLLYKEVTELKYHLLIPLESVPIPVGSVDTFDYDLLTDPSKGKVEGKESLDQVDVEFLLHRDNVKKLQSLEGQVLDFLVVYGNYLGFGYTGTIQVRPNEAAADILRGTFTVTPLTADATIIEDARPLIKGTCWFETSIPDELAISGTGTANAKTLNLVVTPETATISATVALQKLPDGTTTSPAITASVSGKKVTISKSSADAKGIVEIIASVSSTDASGELTWAPWTTTVAVD